jgi:predicted NBD/HSP70 family sugar kinase
VENDANCFVLAEATCGAAEGAGVVFGVIMGTGVGGGIVCNGTLLRGSQGIAGEWGHHSIDPHGPDCYCGQKGCVEQYIAGPAVERRFRQLTNQAVAMNEIVARARSGEAAAAKVMAELVDRFGRALANIVSILDPDVIVLGGGLSKVGRLYENVPRLWSGHVFSAGAADAVRTRLVPAAHGDASGVRGAAWLWRDEA